MGKARSIHLGLNSVDPEHYSGWSGQLNACEQDARDMLRLAMNRGVTTNAVLLTRDATVARFEQAMREAQASLGAGDLLLISYSGHGGQVPDRNGDEADGKDETWCLFDREYVDDELFDLFAGFAPGVRIVVLSDSCHSGTVARVAEYRGFAPDSTTAYRCMPSDRATMVYEQHRRLYDAIQARTRGGRRSQDGASVLLISGCQDSQLSMDGDRNGLFTSKLLEVWNNGLFKGSYRRLHSLIKARMPSTQVPNLFQCGAPDDAFPELEAFDPGASGDMRRDDDPSGLWRRGLPLVDYPVRTQEPGIRAAREPGDIPPGLPTGLNELPQAMNRVFDLSVTGAMSLGIPIAGSVSGGGSRHVLVLERCAFKVLKSGTGLTQEWGYAIRFCLTVNKFDASMKLTLPFLAASAEVGSIEAQWMLQVIGLGGPKIDAVSLPPTELNVETFVLAKQSLAALIGAVRDPDTVFTPQCLREITPADQRDLALRRAVAHTVALDAIADGVTLERAQKRAADPLAADVIRDMYHDIAGIDVPTLEPSSNARAEARRLLGRVDLSF
ncbi:MAG: caspase family protein [Phycisphaerales bacterium]